MQSHLDNGCKGCAKLFGTWRRVHEAGRREASYQPPESVVRSVKGAGVIHGLGMGGRVKSLIAGLLFDSMSTPMAAGVRSTAVSLRQLLYGVGGYRLDLRIEPQENSDKVTLMGQILNSEHPDRPIGLTSVGLRKGKKVTAHSMTNEFGEFQLECELEGSFQLEAGLPHGQVLKIPLVEFVHGRFEKGSETGESIGLKRLPRRVEKSTRKKV